MDMKAIGQFLSGLRKERQLTQEELGERLGISNKTISRWETGTYLPPAEALLALSELYGVSINEILSGRRLSEQEYQEAAEQNLQQTLHSMNFTFEEQKLYFQRKWRTDHRLDMILYCLGLLGLWLYGLLSGRGAFVAAAMVLALLGHGYAYNTMMKYVEQHLYDEGIPVVQEPDPKTEQQLRRRNQNSAWFVGLPVGLLIGSIWDVWAAAVPAGLAIGFVLYMIAGCYSMKKTT